MTEERKEKIDETDETGEKEDVRKKGRYEMRLTRKEGKGKCKEERKEWMRPIRKENE